MRAAWIPALLLLAVPWAALPGAAPEAAADLDLTVRVPAGTYLAARVALDGEGTIRAGGSYLGVRTSQPVLPILAFAVRDGAPWAADNVFAYEATSFSNPHASVVLRAREAGVDLAHGDFTLRGGGTTTRAAPAGDYLLVVLAGPGEGSAELVLRVEGPARLLAREEGPTFVLRGLDAAATAWDVFEEGIPGTHARWWRHDGASFEIPVVGSLFGYLGYHAGPAVWRSPSGAPDRYFVVGGEAGTWRAEFPEDQFVGPLCLGFCVPGDSRTDPTFAVGADVRLGAAGP